MTEKRLIVDEDYNWVDTTTGMRVEVEDAFDLVNELAEENEQLKQQIKKLEAQLYKIEDGVCDICNNMYLVQQGRYFVSKCKKGHDECSKMDLDYCDDFELKDGDVE